MNNQENAICGVYRDKILNSVDALENGLSTSYDEIVKYTNEWYDYSVGCLSRRVIEKMYPEIALRMIADWLQGEYGKKVSTVDLNQEAMYNNGDIQIAYTELGDNNQYPVAVFVNLKDCSLKYRLTDKKGTRWLDNETVVYTSLKHMIRELLEWLDFDELITPFYDYIDKSSEEKANDL